MPKEYKRKTQRPYVNRKVQAIPATFQTGFLNTLDMRTELAKTLRANYDTIVDDLGGVEAIGHIKGALVERLVWLEAVVRHFEQEMAAGKLDRRELTEALTRWTQSTNALINLAKTLGIDRKSSSRPWETIAVPVEHPTTPKHRQGEER